MQFLPATFLLAALSYFLALVAAHPSLAAQPSSTMNMKIMANGTDIKNSADYNYVFTVFTWGSQSNLYVYTSRDGVHFDLLKGPAYVPSNSLIRDPSPILHTDGYYYIAYTTSWESRDFAIARSVSLINWTPYITIKVTVPGITRTWAPEFFQDPDTGKTHIIVSLGTTTSDFHPYLYSAEDESLKEWSGPVEMKGFNPNYIDTFVVKEGGKYHAFTKNEDTKWVEHAVSETLEGPWRFVQTGNFSGWDHLEGPCVTKTMDGRWRLYADAYEGDVRKYMYAESDDLYHWDKYEEVPELSGFVRHGTVLKIH